MVNYAEEADFFKRKKPKKYRSREEIEQRRKERNASRTDADWQQLARDIVYRQLGMAERSEYQLLQALRKRDVPDEIAQETVAKFVAAGLVDDERFAQMYVRSVFHTKAISIRNLRQELKQRGISDEIAQAALAQIEQPEQTQAAVDYAVKKIRGMSGLEREVIYRRLSAQLARRGFDYGDIKTAIDAAFATFVAE